MQNPNINGYSSAFGYNLSNGVTIVVEATKSETATTDASAFDILHQPDPERLERYLCGLEAKERPQPKT